MNLVLEAITAYYFIVDYLIIFNEIFKAVMTVTDSCHMHHSLSECQ